MARNPFSIFIIVYRKKKKMKVLVDIGHPAHVHLLKGTIKNLQRDGHEVIITIKTMPIVKRLLESEGLDYLDLGKKGSTMMSKIWRQLVFDWKIWRLCVKNNVDFAIGSSASITRVSKLCKVVSINMDDDDDEVQQALVHFSHPFSDVRLTPSAIKGHRKSKKAIFYAGTHELAYLHPNCFSPDPSVLAKAGLKEGERFFIMRFVAFKAYHDAGQGGLSMEQKRRLIELLKPYGRVIITSEREIEPEFEMYRLPVPPEEILSLMAYSSMFIGDSQTMTSEAAILGVPALKCNTFAGKLSVPNELEKRYGLCYSYQPKDFELFFDHVKQLLETPNTKEQWALKREHFLSEKIDVSAFFTWFIENYPKSKQIMSETPDYQMRFK